MSGLEEKGLQLIRDENGLKLTDGELELRGDFTKLLPRLKHNNLTHEILIKAARIKAPKKVPAGVLVDAAENAGAMADCDSVLKAEGPMFTLIDATAGLGEDSLLFAAAGFRVMMFERDPVIASLLKDAMERASRIPELAPVVERMELVETDSISYLRGLADKLSEAAALPDTAAVPDVIFLDPMFPERQKSALIKKKMQLLQKLESPSTDEQAMLEAAVAVRPRKIVVKRPLKGPYLAGRKPDYSISGKAIRCDCYVFAR